MTEISALRRTTILTSKYNVVSVDELYDHLIKPGFPVPFVEIRGRNEFGLIPWDGNTMGELEVRGPFVAAAYFNDKDQQGKFTDDGWLKNGDIASISEDGCIERKYRSKEIIKWRGNRC